jgi:hypothetical protein
LDEEKKRAYKTHRVKTKRGKKRIIVEGTEGRQQKPLLIS